MYNSYNKAQKVTNDYLKTIRRRVFSVYNKDYRKASSEEIEKQMYLSEYDVYDPFIDKQNPKASVPIIAHKKYYLSQMEFTKDYTAFPDKRYTTIVAKWVNDPKN